MLRRVADGVLVHESAFCQSNSVVVVGDAGVLLIDPGVHGDELICLANDLSELGEPVVAGFSTHPHWDHLLWHESLGTARRFATARAATTAQERLSGGIDAARFGIPDDVPLEMLGQINGLPDGTLDVPWDGPRVRIIVHQAHAPGHAALLIEGAGVLVAGDLLSEVLIPMLDLNGPADPIGDYLAALELIGSVAGEVGIVIPGHGSVGDAEQLGARIEQDRAYLTSLRDGRVSGDPRIGPHAKPGWEWVSGVHDRQVERLGYAG